MESKGSTEQCLGSSLGVCAGPWSTGFLGLALGAAGPVSRGGSLPAWGRPQDTAVQADGGGPCGRSLASSDFSVKFTDSLGREHRKSSTPPTPCRGPVGREQKQGDSSTAPGPGPHHGSQRTQGATRAQQKSTAVKP